MNKQTINGQLGLVGGQIGAINACNLQPLFERRIVAGAVVVWGRKCLREGSAEQCVERRAGLRRDGSEPMKKRWCRCAPKARDAQNSGGKIRIGLCDAGAHAAFNIERLPREKFWKQCAVAAKLPPIGLARARRARNHGRRAHHSEPRSHQHDEKQSLHAPREKSQNQRAPP